jgi:alpha-tubulin suppressor-like RCC1 family protein
VGGVGTLTSVVAIAAGREHSLALRANGTIVAWGDDEAGELGDSSPNADQAAPRQVVGVGGSGILTNVIAIAAGGDHNLALRGDGTVVAWGYDFCGQLGDGASPGNATSPKVVVGIGGTGTLTSVTAIAAGINHSLALRTGGVAVAWGCDELGQLGNGNTATTPQVAPVSVVGVGGGGALTNMTAIAAGFLHSTAIQADGRIIVWGDDSVTDFVFIESPILVGGIAGSAALATGGIHDRRHFLARQVIGP